MDPGSFGAVTITKALTIAGDGVLAGILASGVSGIIVNAGANDVVYIRNRSINGAGNDESESCEDQTPITVIQSPAAGTPIGLGTHTITLTANDGSSSNGGAGNATTVTTTLTVADQTDPVVSCPTDIEVFLPLDSPDTSMVVNYPAATATDNCSSSPTIS